MTEPDDQASQGGSFGKLWPKLLLSSLVGLTVAVGIVLKLALG